MTKTNIKFDNSMFKAITAVVKGDLKNDRSRVLLNDDFKANGIEYTWFKSPNKKDASDEHKTFYPQALDAVVMAFDSPTRKLLNTPTRLLEAGNKPGQKGDPKNPAVGTKRYCQMQQGRRMNQVGISYMTYLGIKPSKGADQNNQTDLQKICKAFVALQNLIENSEGVRNLDLVETSEHLKDSPIMALLAKK